jgi:hypothetical protein
MAKTKKDIRYVQAKKILTFIVDVFRNWKMERGIYN